MKITISRIKSLKDLKDHDHILVERRREGVRKRIIYSKFNFLWNIYFPRLHFTLNAVSFTLESDVNRLPSFLVEIAGKSGMLSFAS